MIIVRAKGICAFTAALAISGGVFGLTATPGDSATAKDAHGALYAAPAGHGLTGVGPGVRDVFTAYDGQPAGNSRGGGQGNGGGQGSSGASATPNDQGGAPGPQGGGGGIVQ